MTVDEAWGSLASARVRDLFAAGEWVDLYDLRDAYQAAVDKETLQGTEQGEMAFYLGEACLGRSHTDPASDYLEAVGYLEVAVLQADTDFAQWAQEELVRARQLIGGDGSPTGTGTAVAVDVSNHPTLRLGSTEREWVAHAQAKLSSLHNYGGVPDGYFGPATDAAVRSFQASWGMAEDGVVAQVTWAALETAAPGVTVESVRQGAASHPTPHAPASTTVPDVAVEEQPAPVHHWNPEVPDLDPAAPMKPKPDLGAGTTVEHTWKVKVGKDLGPVTIKEIPIKVEGRVHTADGKAADISAWKSEKGPGFEVKIPIEKWEHVWGSNWDVSLKGDLDIGVKTAVTGAIEGTNGHAVLQAQFTLIEASAGEVSFLKVTIGGGGKIDKEPIPGTNGELFFSGKVTVGLTLVPNITWWAAQFGRTVVPAAGTATQFGVGTVAAGEAIIATGFIAGAVAVIYVSYRNMADIQALKRLRTDADAAVNDFAAGFASAWGAGSAPSGYWGETGASAGRRQFDADLRAYQQFMAEKYPGQTLDDATLEEVRQMWRRTAAEKADAFRSVAAAMFGKMVRTAIYQAWLKANSESSLPGDITETARQYAGIPGGNSEHPDVLAGQEAARNANMQINIELWQHALDE